MRLAREKPFSRHDCCHCGVPAYAEPRPDLQYSLRAWGKLTGSSRLISPNAISTSPPTDLQGPALQQWLGTKPAGVEVDDRKLADGELVKWKHQKYMRDCLSCAQDVDGPFDQDQPLVWKTVAESSAAIARS